MRSSVPDCRVSAVKGSHLCNQPLSVMFVMVIMASIAISHRCEGSQPAVDLVVDIDMCLQRVKSFGLIGAVPFECFDVIVTDIAAYSPLGRETEILSETVKKRSGELTVKSHVVCSYAYYAVGTAVTKAECTVQLRRVARKCKEIDIGLRININKSELSGLRIAGEVDDADLHATRVRLRYIDKSQLQSMQCIGIIIGSCLHSMYISRAYIGNAGKLYAASDAHRNIG